MAEDGQKMSEKVVDKRAGMSTMGSSYPDT
jgi:hypothetical protein